MEKESILFRTRKTFLEMLGHDPYFRRLDHVFDDLVVLAASDGYLEASEYKRRCLVKELLDIHKEDIKKNDSLNMYRDRVEVVTVVTEVIVGMLSKDQEAVNKRIIQILLEERARNIDERIKRRKAKVQKALEEAEKDE